MLIFLEECTELEVASNQIAKPSIDNQDMTTLADSSLWSIETSHFKKLEGSRLCRSRDSTSPLTAIFSS